MTRDTPPNPLARHAEFKARTLRDAKRLDDMANQAPKPLKDAARLRAAMFLGDLWQQAKKKGMRQEFLKDGLGKLHEDFRIERWTLRREDVGRHFSELCAIYDGAKHPSRNLRTYLTAVEVIASYLKENVSVKKVSFGHKLELLDNKPDDTEEADLPAEDVQLMFEKVTANFLAQSGWPQIQERMTKLPFVVDIWSGAFKHSKTSWFITEMTGRQFEDCWYAEEIFPHPAVPLGRWQAHEYQVLAGLEPLGISIAEASEGYQSALETITPAQELIEISGTLKVWHEVSLAVVPVLSGGFAPFLRFGLRHSIQIDPDQLPSDDHWVERSNGIPDLMSGRGLVEFGGQACRLFLHDHSYSAIAASKTFPDSLEPEPDVEYRSEFNAAKWEFRPLSSALIRRWLGTEQSDPQRVVTFGGGEMIIPPEECRFATVQVGQAVENALHSGAILATLLKHAQEMDAQAQLVHRIWVEKSERHVAHFLGSQPSDTLPQLPSDNTI